jgi:hypothetical protein
MDEAHKSLAQDLLSLSPAKQVPLILIRANACEVLEPLPVDRGRLTKAPAASSFFV